MASNHVLMAMEEVIKGLYSSGYAATVKTVEMTFDKDDVKDFELYLKKILVQHSNTTGEELWVSVSGINFKISKR